MPAYFCRNRARPAASGAEPTSRGRARSTEEPEGGSEAPSSSMPGPRRDRPTDTGLGGT
jgi:hypothetical protein